MRRAFILPYVLAISTVVMLAAGMTAIMAASFLSYVNSDFEMRKTQYLAEAAVELGKKHIWDNPDWFTDEPRGSLPEKEWVLSGASGMQIAIGCGSVKIIREREKKQLYAVGYLGDNILNPKSRAIVKIEFGLPFSVETWSLI